MLYKDFVLLDAPPMALQMLALPEFQAMIIRARKACDAKALPILEAECKRREATYASH